MQSQQSVWNIMLSNMTNVFVIAKLGRSIVPNDRLVFLCAMHFFQFQLDFMILFACDFSLRNMNIVRANAIMNWKSTNVLSPVIRFGTKRNVSAPVHLTCFKVEVLVIWALFGIPKNAGENNTNNNCTIFIKIFIRFFFVIFADVK